MDLFSYLLGKKSSGGGGGGADLSDYFTTEWNTDTSISNKIKWDVKKYADITIADTVTTLSNAFVSNSNKPLFPKLIFNDNVTNVGSIYQSCNGTTELDLSGWNITNITSFSYMCAYCTKLENLILPSSTCTKDCNLSNMFYSCIGLTTVDFSNLKIDSAKDVANMFYGCSNMISIDISNIKLSRTYNGVVLANIFNGCSKLEHIDIRGMDIVNTGLGNTNNMFSSVPTDCEIIVKDAANKTWFNTNYSSYTNVKTVAEYEA